MNFLNQTTLAFSLAIASFAPLPAASYMQQMNIPSKTRDATNITFETKNGQLQAFITDIVGNKEPLTFGTLVDVGAELIAGKQLSDVRGGRTAPIYVFAERNSKGTLISYVLDAKGNKKRFLINNVLGALADSLDMPNGRSAATPPRGKYFQIYFKEGSDGNLESTLVYPDKKEEPLTLGNLMGAVAAIAENCHSVFDDNRAIYLVGEKNGSVSSETAYNRSSVSGFRVNQIDAYGLKEEFNIDNLFTAVAETLQNCKDHPGTVVAEPPTAPYLMVKLQKGDNNEPMAYLVNAQGEKMDFNLGTLLTASADLLPCSDAAQGDSLTIQFTRDASGNVQSYLTDLQGNKTQLDILSDFATAAAYLPYFQGKSCQQNQ